MKKVPAKKTTTKTKQIYPPGWNEKRVREVIDHYDNQTEDEQLAEYEAAYKTEGQTMLSVPTAMVPEIRAFIKRKQRSR